GLHQYPVATPLQGAAAGPLFLWGRAYPGQRSRGHHPGVVPTPVGRHEAGPTGTGPAGSRAVADCTHFFLWAGFIPASGVGATAWVWFPPPSAGMKPAPTGAGPRSEERRVGKSVSHGGGRTT